MLRTFHQTSAPPPSTEAAENYWLLIGQEGEVLGDEVTSGLVQHEDGARVVVRFDDSVKARGLHCHNPIENTLYLFEADLEKLLP